MRLTEDTNSAHVAKQLRETDRRPSVVAVLGEWLLVRVDLEQLVRIVLPITRWGHALRVVSALAPSSIVDLMAPLDELLEQAELEAESPTNAPASTEVPVASPLSAWEEDVASWLLRLVARIRGYDPDLDSERMPAAEHLLDLLAGLAQPGDELAVEIGAVDSISLDRPATPAAMGSAQLVKADAVRRLFEVNASSIAWAVLDSGINARHPAFLARDGSGLASRVVETFDLTKLSEEQLELVGKEQGPLDHLVDVMQSCAVIAWDGSDASRYKEPIGSHGTHVAGILAGYVPDEFEGMCPDLRLWDFRVLNARSLGNESRVLLALRYIRHMNDRERTLRIAGVNMSISLAYNPKNHACGWTPVCVEVRRLVRSGVVVVVAAGNAGYQAGPAGAAGPLETAGRTKGTGFETVSITDPGNSQEAITVGATHGEHPYRYGTSYFSGKGPTSDGRPKPDLLAPGEHIFGPVGSEAWESMNGTSQAAPHVSGAAALLMARYPELVGEPERVKDILARTATDLGRDRAFQGHGLVDVLRATQSV